MKTSAEVDPVNRAPGGAVSEPPDGKASFAETALKLGGKSEEEARRTGAIDKADDQVEDLFAARFQTINSPDPPGRLGSSAAGRFVFSRTSRSTGRRKAGDG